MARFGDPEGTLKCSFCAKSQWQVRKIIAGPAVYICDECTDLCCELLIEDGIFDLGKRYPDPSSEYLWTSWIDRIDRTDTAQVEKTRKILQQMLERLNQ